MKKLFEYLFEKLLGTFYNLVSFLYLVLESFFKTFPYGINALLNVLKKQIFFTGIEALSFNIYVGIFMGVVVVTQIASFITGLGDLFTISRIIIIGIIREMLPLIIAVITIARSGTAITSELSLMKLQKETLTLESFGINYLYYLILPRIAGVTISGIVLTVIASFTSIISGGFSLYLFTNIAMEDFFDSFFLTISIFDIVLLFAKSFLFGVATSTICSFFGLSVKKSVTEIPQATTRAVLVSFLYVILINVMLDMTVVLWD